MKKVGKPKLFDEKFGPGSICICGSDTVFVTDAIKQGKLMYYVPQAIVVHPPISSGRDYNEKIVYHKGIMYRRCFGLLAFILDLVFAIKKYDEYKHRLGFFKFLFLMWKGSLKSV